MVTLRFSSSLEHHQRAAAAVINLYRKTEDQHVSRQSEESLHL